MIFVAAPNYQMVEFWCRERHLRRPDVRFILSFTDTQYIRGYERPVDVHWINDGPDDQKVRDELYALRAVHIVNIIQEYT